MLCCVLNVFTSSEAPLISKMKWLIYRSFEHHILRELTKATEWQVTKYSNFQIFKHVFSQPEAVIIIMHSFNNFSLGNTYKQGVLFCMLFYLDTLANSGGVLVAKFFFFSLSKYVTYLSLKISYLFRLPKYVILITFVDKDDGMYSSSSFHFSLSRHRKTTFSVLFYD